MENKKPKQVNPNTAPPHEFLKYVDELEAYVNELEEQLRLSVVVGRSEQLICPNCGKEHDSDEWNEYCSKICWWGLPVDCP